MARKILLADDSVTAQNMGRKILADAGYEVITVNNGSAALKKIGEQRPDLIVLDVYMPGYSGLEVCQRLKEVGETARIPILLTVGKLEPFKTDEAKRVRADGFIVKPFEASELLSALSKLEDKIVPSGESKPGRFARATAAIEEGRDRTVAADEDSGWRSRISFPSKKKKESAPAPEADDPTIYNPVNKDLRTVVEHHAEPAPKADSEEQHVDVGALAPEGLPKDVTPEEIAALAAAAAQMQGKVLEDKAPELREAAVEAKPEIAEAVVPAEPVAASQLPAVTFAEQSAMEAVAPRFEVSTTANEVPATQQEPAVESQSSGHKDAEEPVTMAAAAGLQTGGAPSRWTAVSVALAPEESGLSLEREMQKANAEFTAADVQSTTSAVPVEPPVDSAVSAESAAQVAAEAAPAVEDVAPSITAEAVPAMKEFEISNPEPIEGAPVTAEIPDTTAPEPTTVQASAIAIAEIKVEEASAMAEESRPELAEIAPEPALVVPETSAQEPASNESPVAAVEGSTETKEPEAVSEAAPRAESEPAARAEEYPEKKDDISATTAAAWASWRKIRESDDHHLPERSQNEKDAIDAAMAVAAGAERSPEDAAESDPAIASIVDSVLADLRPKIVEEISRKLGKKK